MNPYTTPPPQGWHYAPYASPAASPPPHYPTYYPQQYATPTPSPVSRSASKRHSTHARKSSFSYTPNPYSGYEQIYSSHSGKQHDVSPLNGMKEKIRRFSMSGKGGHTRTSSRPQKQQFYQDEVEYAYHDVPRVYRESTSKARGHKQRLSTDGYYYYSQVPDRHYEDIKRSRGRSASTSQKTTSQKPKVSPVKPTRVATESDAIRAGIPAGYSTKNWDPTESPIILLGSVFDANSLGKWIYDWTVYHHGASSPMSDVAGDLWLLLIKLSGKVKRADECVPRIRSRESREMVEDFLESGERLWLRFKKLLKACEHFMWRAAKREGGSKSVSMGKNSGCEFVASIFGRDRELENTEKLMNSIRLWNMRYDANIEDILRRPGA